MINLKKFAALGIILLFGFTTIFAGTLSNNPKVSPYVKVLLDRLEERNITASDYRALGLEKSEHGTKISLLLPYRDKDYIGGRI